MFSKILAFAMLAMILFVDGMELRSNDRKLEEPSESSLIKFPIIYPIIYPTFKFRYVELGKKVNWKQASDYCMDNFGTHLATVEDFPALQEIYDLWASKGYKSMWIGLNALHSSASTKELDQGYGWEWASGTPYVNNYFRESKKSNKEKCVIFSNSDKFRVWHNERCSRKFLAFACDNH